jgi:O-antigen ligase
MLNSSSLRIHFKSIIDSFDYYLVALIGVVVTLPLNIFTNTIALYLLAVAWLFDTSFNNKKNKLLSYRKIIIFFVGYFFLHVCGLAYTSNLEAGLMVLEKNISFLALPVIVFTGRLLTQHEQKIIFKAFIVSCFIVSLVNLISSFNEFLLTRNVEEFFYYRLTKTFDFHPVYLSIYFLFCVALLYSFLDNTKTLWQKFGLLLLLIFFIGNILLLESKIVYGILSVLLAGSLYIYVWKKTNSKYLPRLALVLMISCSALLIAKFSSRFKEISAVSSLSILSTNSIDDFSKVNGLTIRLLFWNNGLFEFLKGNKFIFGLGTGDVQDFLDDTYEKHNMASVQSDGVAYGYYGYDIHNQFLDVFFRFGLVGLVFFILFLRQIHKYLRGGDASLIIFYAILVVCLTETFFGLNKGIVFFSFFFPIFIKET